MSTRFQTSLLFFFAASASEFELNNEFVFYGDALQLKFNLFLMNFTTLKR